MSVNYLPLQNGEAITLQGRYDGSILDFEILARLMHTELLPSVPEEAHFVLEPTGSAIPYGLFSCYDGIRFQIFYDPLKRQFRLYLKENAAAERGEEYRVYLWKAAVVCGTLAMLLRNKPVLLVHCGMLERDGNALLLCGESGVGKSTTSRRWRESGGTAIADDMVLLEFTDGQDILVHRLPTWSACHVSLDGRSYPFDPPLRLKGILALSRSLEGEAEHVRKISSADYFAQVYRCVFFHSQFYLRPLPAEYSQGAALLMRELTERLMDRFEPAGLFASLDGDIQSTLKDYL